MRKDKTMKRQKHDATESECPSPIIGRWIITEMEAWGPESLNMEVQAFIEFDPDGGGQFQFCLVQGFVDCCLTERKGKPSVEWSWEGSDEMDPACGRGWAIVEKDGTLRGRVFIHNGDSSEFAAVRAK
ncbi:MAG: hypothetical protein ACYS76_08855 [Planctomycetota bacterium]|jgi:hypothetical protein